MVYYLNERCLNCSVRGRVSHIRKSFWTLPTVKSAVSKGLDTADLAIELAASLKQYTKGYSGLSGAVMQLKVHQGFMRFQSFHNMSPGQTPSP